MKLFVMSSSELSGEVKAPPSKSYTIRAVTAALLADGVSIIKDPLYSEDTRACIMISKSLGAVIKKTDDSLRISGVVGLPKRPSVVLNALNSGTTIRIMTAVSSLCGESVTLTGDKSIQKRPIEPMLMALRQLGVNAVSKNGYPPVTVEGPLVGGMCTMRGDISSQFVSALLMALPCAKRNSEINIIGELRSKPYVDMTLDVMGRFKVVVKPENHVRYIIQGDQTYRATTYTVEGDYSSAAFLLGAAALTDSSVTVKNLFRTSKQADKMFISMLKQMGVKVYVGENYTTVQGNGRLKGIDVDLSDSPDLLPITAVLGAFAEGRTRIYNVAHARLKECDRIKAMYTELRKMGASITENPDGLDIQGGQLNGALLEGWKDHRIVMALAIAGLKAEGKTEITDRESIDVTFPNFISLMKTLGANMR
ncbi:MAG: 3-phosphoshikimate 1-carboxyvinyltransferase [Candidatus Altiarchaeota archaeon]